MRPVKPKRNQGGGYPNRAAVAAVRTNRAPNPRGASPFHWASKEGGAPDKSRRFNHGEDLGCDGTRPAWWGFESRQDRKHTKSDRLCDCLLRSSAAWSGRFNWIRSPWYGSTERTFTPVAHPIDRRTGEITGPVPSGSSASLVEACQAVRRVALMTAVMTIAEIAGFSRFGKAAWTDGHLVSAANRARVHRASVPAAIANQAKQPLPKRFNRLMNRVPHSNSVVSARIATDSSSVSG